MRWHDRATGGHAACARPRRTATLTPHERGPRPPARDNQRTGWLPRRTESDPPWWRGHVRPALHTTVNGAVTASRWSTTANSGQHGEHSAYGSTGIGCNPVDPAVRVAPQGERHRLCRPRSRQGIPDPVVRPAPTPSTWWTTSTVGTRVPRLDYMHALNWPTGAEEPGFPGPDRRTAQNQPTETFDPTMSSSAPACCS